MRRVPELVSGNCLYDQTFCRYFRPGAYLRPNKGWFSRSTSNEQPLHCSPPVSVRPSGCAEHKSIRPGTLRNIRNKANLSMPGLLDLRENKQSVTPSVCFSALAVRKWSLMRAI